MDRYKKILSEIIKGKNQWSDLKVELSEHNINNRSLGPDFEFFVIKINYTLKNYLYI